MLNGVEKFAQILRLCPVILENVLLKLEIVSILGLHGPLVPPLVALVTNTETLISLNPQLTAENLALAPNGKNVRLSLARLTAATPGKTGAPVVEPAVAVSNGDSLSSMSLVPGALHALPSNIVIVIPTLVPHRALTVAIPGVIGLIVRTARMHTAMPWSLSLLLITEGSIVLLWSIRTAHCREIAQKGTACIPGVTGVIVLQNAEEGSG